MTAESPARLRERAEWREAIVSDLKDAIGPIFLGNEVSLLREVRRVFANDRDWLAMAETYTAAGCAVRDDLKHFGGIWQ